MSNPNQFRKVVINQGSVTATPPPPPSSSDKHFLYSQDTASAFWTVAHNLGKYPSITVIDSTGVEVDGTYKHLDANNVELMFTEAFVGKAFFN
jgi:hypothetical protein